MTSLASELCTDCGLCCDGAMFSSVSLEDAGVVAARAHGLPFENTPNAHLVLPCPALCGVLCGIYEERPACCSEFSCALADRVDQQKLSLAAARRIIETTRAIRARVTAAVGATPWWLAHRSALEAERSSPSWARENEALLSDLKALKTAIVRQFWGESIAR